MTRPSNSLFDIVGSSILDEDLMTNRNPVPGKKQHGLLTSLILLGFAVASGQSLPLPTKRGESDADRYQRICQVMRAQRVERLTVKIEEYYTKLVKSRSVRTPQAKLNRKFFRKKLKVLRAEVAEANSRGWNPTLIPESAKVGQAGVWQTERSGVARSVEGWVAVTDPIRCRVLHGQTMADNSIIVKFTRWQKTLAVIGFENYGQASEDGYLDLSGQAFEVLGKANFEGEAITVARRLDLSG